MLSCAVLTMKVPFLDLTRQIKILRPQINRTFDALLRNPEFVLGSPVERFEREFAKLCKKRFCASVNSGTDALTLALKAYGIGKGDEVITAPNSFFSTAMAISNTGATVVFVDCNYDFHTIDVNKLQRKITKRTRGIIPIHLYGQAADMKAVLAIARKYRLIIIEDVCQAHGAKYKGKILPYTETGAFSFYPTKNLGAFGDGGCVVTDNALVYKRLVMLRNNGSKDKYIHPMFGINSRLDSIQASMLSLKLTTLSDDNKKRRRLATAYTTYLSDIPSISTPKEMEGNYHVYHLYVIECDRRDELQQYLHGKNIGTLIHYPVPIHLQKPYKQLGHKRGQFPVTEKKAQRVLSLPLYPELTMQEVKYTCQAIRRFYSERNQRSVRLSP